MANDGDIARLIGQQLRKRRRALGLSQDAVGAAVGVSFQQIQKYESGLSRISAVCLWKLAEALDASMDYFVDGAARGEPLRRTPRPEPAE